MHLIDKNEEYTGCMVLAGKITPFQSFMLLYITHIADIKWNRQSMLHESGKAPESGGNTRHYNSSFQAHCRVIVLITKESVQAPGSMVRNTQCVSHFYCDELFRVLKV